MMVHVSCSKQEPVVSGKIETVDVSEITNTSAECGGIITFDSQKKDVYSQIIQKGIIWSDKSIISDQNLKTIRDAFESNGEVFDIKDITKIDGIRINDIPFQDDSGNFLCRMINLNPETKYYVRAFAQIKDLKDHYVYGNIESFTTSKTLVLPTLTMRTTTNIGSTTATFNGEILTDGTPAYIERGFVCSLSSMPTLENSIAKVPALLASEKIFSQNISGLTLGQVYYVRAFAINEAGTAYSNNQTNFVTAMILPEVTTQDVTNKSIAMGTATFNGTVISVGDPAYNERGFVYGLQRNPTENSGTKIIVAGVGTGTFNTTVTSGLVEGNIYYVRAYVKTEKGYSYSDTDVELNFHAVMPQISTQEVTVISIAAMTATFNGTIVSSGDPAYSERGFVYGLQRNPTESSATKIKVAGSGTGKFNTAVTSELAEGNTYYVRAYAKTEKEYTYSPTDVQLNFIAIPPEVTTQEVSNISIASGTATFNGTIISIGDPAYTDRGFVYGFQHNPTESSGTKIEVTGSGTGLFNTTLSSGLAEGNIYYVRAYAKTEKGYTFSNVDVQLNFNAVIPAPTMQTTSSIGATAATFNGNITSVGDPSYIEKGFVYSTNVNPTIENGTKEVAPGNGTGVFSKVITGLAEGTTYFMNAYVTYPKGTVYGSVQSFSTRIAQITGTVKNQTGAGINNASVILRQGTSTVHQATTNSTGAFTITNVATGSYTVATTSMGYIDNTKSVSLSASQNTIEIVMTPLGRILGTLKDDDGIAMSNVNVRLFRGSTQQANVNTNTNGEFTFSNLNPDNYSIRVTVDNYEDLNNTITVASGENSRDFMMKINNPFDFDDGSGVFKPFGSPFDLYFECNNPALVGQKTTKNIRIKNNRQITIPWSITGMPSQGITLSSSNGNIAASATITITATFTYPGTSATILNLTGCVIGTNTYSKTYVWNWAEIGAGLYADVINQRWIEYNCSAASHHMPNITVGGFNDSFSLVFNQFVVWQ